MASKRRAVWLGVSQNGENRILHKFTAQWQCLRRQFTRGKSGTTMTFAARANNRKTFSFCSQRQITMILHSCNDMLRGFNCRDRCNRHREWGLGRPTSSFDQNSIRFSTSEHRMAGCGSTILHIISVWRVFYWMIDVNVRGVCSTLCTHTFHSLSSVAGQKATNGRMWIQVVNPLSAAAAVVHNWFRFYNFYSNTHTHIDRAFLSLSLFCSPYYSLIIRFRFDRLCTFFFLHWISMCLHMPIDSHRWRPDGNGLNKQFSFVFVLLVFIFVFSRGHFSIAHTKFGFGSFSFVWYARSAAS